MSDIYRSQVSPGGTPVYGGASAAAFGADAGRGMEELGGAMAAEARRRADEAKKREDEAAAVDAARQAAAFRLEAERRRIEAEEAPPPGGAGHAAAYLDWYDKGQAKLLEGIGNEGARNRVSIELADTRARLGARALTFEAAARGNRQGQDFEDQAGYAAEVVRLNPTRQALIEEVAAGEATIDAWTAPDEKKREGKAALRNLLAEAYVRALPAEEAKQALDSGEFATWLKPDTAKALVSHVGVEERRLEAERAAAARLRIAAVKDALDLIDKRLAAGEDVPDAELANAAEAAGLIGEEGIAYDFNVKRQRAGINRETQSWPAQRYDEEINALRAKGEKRTPAEDIRLDQVEAIKAARIAEYNDNPGGYAAANGLAPPDFDFDDPAKLGAYAAWAEKVRRATGRPAPYIPPQLVPQLAERLDQGPAARREVAETLMRFGDPARIRGAAELIAKHDEPFKIAIRLSTLPDQRVAAQRMRDALAGPDALKANPAIWSEAEARVVMGEIAPALRGLPEAYRAGLYETAKNLYATRSARGGADGWNEDRFRMALHQALGAAGEGGAKRGGFGSMPALGGDRAYVLPVDMTEAEFEQRLFRADGEALMRGAVGGRLPVRSQAKDAAPVYSGEIKKFEPVAVGDGIYQFWTGAGFLPAKGGGPWRLDIRKVGGR
ncbi:MAG TPA: hypothetical protein VGW34_09970 [Allosphingosinicella sp.]|nr:hypothetical protein [Allosphingosinicella sp.]